MKLPPTTAMALAENLARTYESTGRDLAELLSAFVGVVIERDERVGHDCLTALDSWVTKGNKQMQTPVDTKDGVEVTPEMIDAGVEVYIQFMGGKSASDGILTERDFVSAIYSVMHKARR